MLWGFYICICIRYVCMFMFCKKKKICVNIFYMNIIYNILVMFLGVVCFYLWDLIVDFCIRIFKKYCKI